MMTSLRKVDVAHAPVVMKLHVLVVLFSLLSPCLNGQELQECQSNPCQHAARCVEGTGGYACQCQPGFIGVHCETNVNECLSSPCVNQGTCQDAANGYVCICKLGFAGPNCHYNVVSQASISLGILSTHTIPRDGPPESVTSLRLEKATAASLMVAWTPGLNGGHDQMFTVEYWDSTSVWKSSQLEGSVDNWTATRLQPEREYTFHVLSSNSRGLAPSLQNETFRTLAPPQFLNAPIATLRETYVILSNWSINDTSQVDEFQAMCCDRKGVDCETNTTTDITGGKLRVNLPSEDAFYIFSYIFRWQGVVVQSIENAAIICREVPNTHLNIGGIVVATFVVVAAVVIVVILFKKGIIAFPRQSKGHMDGVGDFHQTSSHHGVLQSNLYENETFHEGHHSSDPELYAEVDECQTLGNFVSTSPYAHLTGTAEQENLSSTYASLGAGLAAGDVTLIENLHDGHHFTVSLGTLAEGKHTRHKIVMKQARVSAEEERLSSEIEALKLIGVHPNVILLIGSYRIIKNGPEVMIMEYATKGKLVDFLHHLETDVYKNFEGPLNQLLYKTCLDTIRGLMAIQQLKERVVLPCLSGDNVLVTSEGVCKLTGMQTKAEYQEHWSQNEALQSSRWVAVEVLEDAKNHGSKSDVWSMAVLIWHIFSIGEEPFSSVADANIKQHVSLGNRLQKSRHVTSKLYNQLLLCWATNAKFRPGMKDLCKVLEDTSRTSV